MNPRMTSTTQSGSSDPSNLPEFGHDNVRPGNAQTCIRIAHHADDRSGDNGSLLAPHAQIVACVRAKRRKGRMDYAYEEKAL